MIENEYTEREAAALLRVSERFLRGERASGKIAFARRGRKVLYPARTIREYQEGQMTRTSPAATVVGMSKVARDLRSIGARARRAAA
jgi:hypothetical protein